MTLRRNLLFASVFLKMQYSLWHGKDEKDSRNNPWEGSTALQIQTILRDIARCLNVCLILESECLVHSLTILFINVLPSISQCLIVFVYE